MQKLALFTTAVLALLSTSVSAKWSFGGCQQPNTKASFDADSYLGTWYEIARDEGLVFEYGDCVQATYSKKNDKIINVHNTLENPFTGNVDGVKGTATCKDNGRCLVGFFIGRDGDYRVIDTDYTSYSVVYSCSPWFFGLFKSENVWILSRTQTLDASTLTAVQTTLQTEVPKYSLDNLYYTVQDANCNYLY